MTKIDNYLDICNGQSKCSDSTDELNCPTCGEYEFTCKCREDAFSGCTHTEGCIPVENVNDGKLDCPHGSDEPERYTEVARSLTNSDLINIIGSLYRFVNATEAIRVQKYHGVTTCFETRSHTCTSKDCNKTNVLCSHSLYRGQCQCDPIFQCSNGNLIAAFQFCDGNIDCSDNSDEIRHLPGFICTQSQHECVLPQPNLYDDIAHCNNGLDRLCNHGSCFECLDGRLLISSDQVCDGFIDCYDLSDECLCNLNLNKPSFQILDINRSDCLTKTCILNSSVKNLIQILLINYPVFKYSFVEGNVDNIKNYFHQIKPKKEQPTCLTRRGIISPLLCDGRLECRDFSDECNCDDPPSICNDSCFSFYPFGDRYCDGFVDEAWKYINDTACPEGFDEVACPGRFDCKSGDKVSIPVSLICNREIDCDDGSDEQKCSSFSSLEEMIANPVLRYSFWIMGFVVIVGNLFVIVAKTSLLRKSTTTGLIRCQHIIILNISCADLLMGIYLISIAIFSQKFSGFYGSIDFEWRTGLSCSIIGSLSVISSEASCFLMATLSLLRVFSVYKPFASITANTTPWKIAIVCSWSIAITFGTVPIPHRALHYFVHSIFLPNAYSASGIWSKSDSVTFACRYAALKNLTIKCEGNEWESTRDFLESNFAEYAPLKEFGYYGETSVCMPRFYVAHGDNAWEYTLTIITINFAAFIFIAASYILVYCKSKKRSNMLQKNKKKQEQKEVKMQQRIARIIITDFLCWIPICIMSYIRFGGIEIPFVVYQISAVYLLPINSALNPFLFSPLPDTIMEKLINFTRSQRSAEKNST